MTHSKTRPGSARAKLAAFLSTARQEADLTWAELADAAQQDGPGRSVATLKRAARPDAPVPREDTVTAYVRACRPAQVAEGEALRLWRRARIEERGILPGLQAPGAAFVRNRADLLAALAAAYEHAGAPPLRTLQERAGRTNDVFLLPISTAWRIIKRQCLPADARQYEAFLQGCGITDKAMPDWHQAWQHATTPPPASSSSAQDAERLTYLLNLSLYDPPRKARSPYFRKRDALDKVGPKWQQLLSRSTATTVEEILEAGLLHVTAARAHRNGTTTKGHQADGPLWTYQHIAAHIGVQPDTVRSYRKHGLLPPPDQVEAGTPYWHPDTIRTWIANRPGAAQARPPG